MNRERTLVVGRMKDEPRNPDRPSRRMMKTWARRIAQGAARPVPVFIGGAWSLQIERGEKRALQVRPDHN